MVDPHDEFGPGMSEPEPELTPEPGPEPVSEPELSLPPLPPEDVPGDLDLGATPRPAPRFADEAPRPSVVPMALGALLVVALVAVWALKAKSKPVAGPAGAAHAPADTAKTKAEGEKTGVDVASLRSDVEGLRAALKALQDRVEALPGPAPAPDLTPLNGKIDDLSGAIKPLADLPKKVGDLDHHLATIDESLNSVRSEVDALEDEVVKRGETRPASSLPEPAQAVSNQPEDVNVADDAMDQGVELFQAGKYQEASDLFRKLTETHPKDARVWYYAALSRGSATKDWKGETTRLVEKGVEREKAGSPESAQIDAVFTDLNPAFKPWLDAYRKGARPR